MSGLSTSYAQPMTVIAYRPLPEELQRRIASRHNLICVDPFSNQAEFERVLAGADGVIGASWKLDRRQLEIARKLKVVSSISAGVDHVDVNVLRDRGVMLCSTQGKVEECVADLAFTLMLTISRRVPEMISLVRDGRWSRPVGAEYFGKDVYGKTLGILGFGGIGQAIARRAALGFNMRVLYYRRKRDNEGPDPRIQPADLGSLLRQADVVVSTLPISDDTRSLMDAAAFEAMKDGAIFINVGRGGTVDEKALLQALDSGKLFGAGLDVYETEPLPTDSPLRSHPKVVPLPHIGAATHETRFSMLDYATENLLEALDGRRPEGLVD